MERILVLVCMALFLWPFVSVEDAGAARFANNNDVYGSVIRKTGMDVWSSETRGSEAACFYFGGGSRFWNLQSYSGNGQALQVRSGK